LNLLLLHANLLIFTQISDETDFAMPIFTFASKNIAMLYLKKS